MHHVSSQSHHPRDGSWPAVPDETVDELEGGQRLRAVRSQQPKQQPQQPQAALARQHLIPRQLRSNARLRAHLLRLLLLALSVVLLLIVFLTAVLPAWRSATQRSAALARNHAALRRAGVLSDELPHELSTDGAALQELVAFYSPDGGDGVDRTPTETPTDAEQQPQQLLVVHVAHGLSNRIRTLASALVVAHHFHLALRLIWIPDHHCRAAFTQLFTLPNTTDTHITHTVMDTWHRFQPHHLCSTQHCATAAQHLSPTHYHAYHYITPSNTALDAHQPIQPPSQPGHTPHSLYVHASSRLNHTAVHSARDVWPGMVALRPVADVAGLVAGFERAYGAGGLRGVVGLHVRQVRAEGEMDGLQQHEYTASAWAALATARRLSGIDYFKQLITTTLQTTPTTTFYIAADSPLPITQLRQHFTQPRLFLSLRDALPAHALMAACDGHDRSVACMQFALADQLLLARCHTIYGSVWSSYSEVAGLWRMSQVLYAEDAVQQVMAAARAVAHNTSGGFGAGELQG